MSENEDKAEIIFITGANITDEQRDRLMEHIAKQVRGEGDVVVIELPGGAKVRHAQANDIIAGLDIVEQKKGQGVSISRGGLLLSPGVIVKQSSPLPNTQCDWCERMASTSQEVEGSIRNLCPQCTAEHYKFEARESETRKPAKCFYCGGKADFIGSDGETVCSSCGEA